MRCGLILYFLFFTVTCIAQANKDSLEKAKREKRQLLSQQRQIRIQEAYSRCVRLQGSIADGLTTFMPGSGTSIVLFQVLDSDSSYYKNKQVLIIIPGSEVRRLNKTSTFELAVTGYNNCKCEGFNWVKYKDAGLKTMYLIDDSKAVKELP